MSPSKHKMGLEWGLDRDGGWKGMVSTYGSVAKRKLMLSHQQFTGMGLPACSKRWWYFLAVSHLTYIPNVFISHSCEWLPPHCLGMLPTDFARRNEDAELLVSLTPIAKQ